MRSAFPKKLLGSVRRPSLAGDGLPERMRSTVVAFLGLTAAAGLALVAVFAQLGFPLLSPAPLPSAAPGRDSVAEAVPLRSDPAVVGLAQAQGAVAAPGSSGGQSDPRAATRDERDPHLDGSAIPVSGSPAGDAPGASEPAATPSPESSPAAPAAPAPSPAPTSEPAPAPVEIPVASPDIGEQPSKPKPVASKPSKPGAKPASTKPPKIETKPVETKPSKPESESAKSDAKSDARPAKPEADPAPETSYVPAPAPDPDHKDKGKDKEKKGK